MNLRDYVAQQIEEENRTIVNPNLQFKLAQDPNEIVNLYRTYDGIKRHMRALSKDKVEEYMQNGYAFVGAYYDKKLAGIAVSKQLPENYPYFTLPKNEQKGNIYTLGGLYVNPKFQGLGMASKLGRVITTGTENFGKENPEEAVGMAYEVSYDNYGSLKILSKHGNYVGFYSDSGYQEGLTILMYRPFLHEAVKIDKPNIVLTPDEQTSMNNLTESLTQISNNQEIGGLTQFDNVLENESVVATMVLNNTPSTIPQPTFEIVKE